MSTFEPTKPWCRNTRRIKDAIASNNARIICLGDSETLTNNSTFAYKGGALMMAQIGVFGEVKAWQDTAVNSSSMRVYLYAPNGTGYANVTYNRSADPIVGLPPDTEFVGLPISLIGLNVTDNTKTIGGKQMGAVVITPAALASSFYPMDLAASKMYAIRPLYYCPANAAHIYTQNLYLRDGGDSGTIRATVNMSTGAATGDGTPVAGGINRFASDVGLTAGSTTERRLAITYTGSTLAGTGLYLQAPPVFYEASGTAAAPVFVGGNYVQVLADASMQVGGFVVDQSPTDDPDGYGKVDTSAHWLQLLQVTTIDANQQPIIVLRCDTEYSVDAGSLGSYGAGGTLSSVAEHLIVLNALVARWDALCASAGLPTPLYWVQQMPHHWQSSSSGFGNGPTSASKVASVNNPKHDMFLQALHAMAMDNPRFAYTSMYAWFDGFMPSTLPDAFEGNSDQITGSKAILDANFGSGWVPAGTTYSAYTPGSGGDEANLMDANGLHSKSANAERVFAQIMKWGLDVLDNGGGAARNRSRSRARAGSF